MTKGVNSVNEDAYMVVVAVVPIRDELASHKIISDLAARNSIMQTSLINPIDVMQDDEYFGMMDSLVDAILQRMRSNGFPRR